MFAEPEFAGESSSGDGVIGVTHSEKKNGVVGIIETGPGSMNIKSITFGLGNGVLVFRARLTPAECGGLAAQPAFQEPATKAMEFTAYPTQF